MRFHLGSRTTSVVISLSLNDEICVVIIKIVVGVSHFWMVFDAAVLIRNSYRWGCKWDVTVLSEAASVVSLNEQGLLLAHQTRYL